MLTRDEARKLADRVLALSAADEAQVSLSDEVGTHLRFARNTPSTSGAYASPSLSITSTFGKRSGTVRINQFDEATLREGVARSEAMAELAPEDPEHMPALGPQTYVEVDAHDPATAADAAEPMARGVARCIDDASKKKLVAAGFTMSTGTASALATSRGLFAYHRATTAYAAETVRTPDGLGSGWAQAASHKVADIDYAALSTTAVNKSIASRDPRPLEPGVYETILEPACVASLIGALTWSMNARSADEGRSFFSSPGGGNRIGEKLFGDDIDIFSDPAHPEVPGRPWSGDGLPQARRTWIHEGTLKNLVYDRYWAEKNDTAPVPYPSNLIMRGGSGTLEDLIASTERGVLITSLWYMRSVDPRTLLYTGLTRDGVFLIEHGKIDRPVNNFRWNNSPIAVLKNVVAMSEAVRMPPRARRSATTMVPALKVSKFELTSVSHAV